MVKTGYDLLVMQQVELLQALAKKLKYLRKLNGLSQDEVLFDTDIHIARIEQEKEIFLLLHYVVCEIILRFL